MTLTIAAGVLNIATAIAANCHYIIVDGEGSADDLLLEITNGASAIPDGYYVQLEAPAPWGAAAVISITDGTNIMLSDRDRANPITLGEYVLQAFAVYSDALNNWIVSSDQVSDKVISSDAASEVTAHDGIAFAVVDGLTAWQATPGLLEVFRNLRLNYSIEGTGLLTIEESPAAPPTPAANDLAIYVKDKAGVSTLYIKKDNGVEVELG